MNHQITAPLAVMVFSFTGCAFQESLQSGTDTPCETFREIVEDYPANFATFRKGGSNFRSVTIYRAKEELIKGHCEIWAWGNADSAYVCHVGAPDLEVAETRYTSAVEQISNCIGPEWATTEAARESDGKETGMITRFKHQGAEAPVVSVQIVENGSRRSVYLYIGSPARAL